MLTGSDSFFDSWTGSGIRRKWRRRPRSLGSHSWLRTATTRLMIGIGPLASMLVLIAWLRLEWNWGYSHVMVVLEPFAFRWKGIFTQLMKAWVTDRSLLAIPWLGTLMFRYYIQVCTLVSHLGMYLYTYDTYIYIYIYVLMDIYACTYAKRMCVYIYIYIYICIWEHTFIYVCIYIKRLSIQML